MLTMIDWYANSDEPIMVDHFVHPDSAHDAYQKSKILAEKFAFDFM